MKEKRKNIIQKKSKKESKKEYKTKESKKI